MYETKSIQIEVDGQKMHKQADDRAMQKILEENILKVNNKSFTQIVILGSSAFVPFMQLSGSNRREVIEDLLDICLLYTSPSPRDRQKSRMPSSA